MHTQVADQYPGAAPRDQSRRTARYQYLSIFVGDVYTSAADWLTLVPLQDLSQGPVDPALNAPGFPAELVMPYAPTSNKIRSAVMQLNLQMDSARWDGVDSISRPQQRGKGLWRCRCTSRRSMPGQ